jgi:hypothetical protein
MFGGGEVANTTAKGTLNRSSDAAKNSTTYRILLRLLLTNAFGGTISVKPICRGVRPLSTGVRDGCDKSVGLGETSVILLAPVFAFIKVSLSGMIVGTLFGCTSFTMALRERARAKPRRPM